MEDAFVQLLADLSNGNSLPNRARLSDLSDLDADHLRHFQETWNQMRGEARQRLLEQLGTLADVQIELSFEAINRMAVSDQLPEVRVQAIENLWESEDPGLVQPLLTALQHDPSDTVRGAAAKALGAFVLLAETRSLPPELTASIENGLLQAQSSDDNEQVRDRALESLGYSSRAEVPSLIESAFQSSSEPRVQSALRAIARSANPRWTQHALDRLHHPSPQIRLEAAQAIGEIDAREAAGELLDLVDDVDDQVRQAAIWSLGQLGGSLAAETLAALLEAAEDDTERELLQDAIDNMDFVQSTRALLQYAPDRLEGHAD